MLRRKDRLPEFVAMLCGAAALLAYFALGNATIAVIALIAGLAALAWSYLDVGR